MSANPSFLGFPLRLSEGRKPEIVILELLTAAPMQDGIAAVTPWLRMLSALPARKMRD